MQLNKKGISGITILIILIAGILFAVIGSLFILETSYTLEQKAQSTSKKATTNLANKLFIDEVGAQFNEDGTLLNFTMMVQLLPSSDRLSLEYLDIVVQTPNDSIVLTYKDNGTITEGNSGFNTFRTEEVGFVNATTPFILDGDYDDDRLDDMITIDSNGYVHVNYSSGTSYMLNQIRCDGTPKTKYAVLEPNDGNIDTIIFDGYCGNTTILDSVTFQIVPERYGRGYFTIEYLQQSQRDHLDGKISKGDIIRIYFELMEPIGVDTPITITLTPADGNPTEKRIMIPSQSSIGNIFFN